MIEFLKRIIMDVRRSLTHEQHKSQRVSFTPKEALKEPGVVGIASELVSVASQYQQIRGIPSWKVLVVDNIDHAIAMEKNTDTV